MINRKIDAAKVEELIDGSSYGWYGIRIDDRLYSVGDNMPASRVWDYGEPTSDYLDGTSCVGIAYTTEIDKAVKIANLYFGDHAYLIAGDSAEFGEDEGEYIIDNAVVIGKLD